MLIGGRIPSDSRRFSVKSICSATSDLSHPKLTARRRRRRQQFRKFDI